MLTARAQLNAEKSHNHMLQSCTEHLKMASEQKLTKELEGAYFDFVHDIKSKCSGEKKASETFWASRISITKANETELNETQ